MKENSVQTKRTNLSVKSVLGKGIYKFKHMSSAKHILLFYLFITLAGALLLWAPFSQTGNLVWDPAVDKITKRGYISFTDALFTSASSFSDTGLAPYSSAVTFNIFGQSIIALLILVGGLGFLALKAYIFNIIFGSPISFKSREVLSAERGTKNVGVTRELIKIAITTLLIMTTMFAIILSIYFYFAEIPADKVKEIYESPTGNAYTSLRFGFFHSISALNNAGFDIVGNSSLQPYYFNFGAQIMFIFLFIIGGLGFPVVYDVYKFFQSKVTGESFKFSLFTKLSTMTYFLIAIFGLMSAFLIEYFSDNSLYSSSSKIYGNNGDKTMALFFNTMSTRNAGFSTIPMHNLSRGTLILYITLMFVGSAPSSTAGGIRTTTFAIAVLGIWARLRGRENVYIFKKKIPQKTVNNSYVVFTISIFILILGSLISLSSLDTNGGDIQTLDGLVKENPKLTIDQIRANTGIYKVHNFTEILFEVGSAFGTTGLSTGITPNLSVYSKITLILIMFVGQLGVSSSILIWGRRKSKGKLISYASQDVRIG